MEWLCPRAHAIRMDRATKLVTGAAFETRAQKYGNSLPVIRYPLSVGRYPLAVGRYPPFLFSVPHSSFFTLQSSIFNLQFSTSPSSPLENEILVVPRNGIVVAR